MYVFFNFGVKSQEQALFILDMLLRATIWL